MVLKDRRGLVIPLGLQVYLTSSPFAEEGVSIT